MPTRPSVADPADPPPAPAPAATPARDEGERAALAVEIDQLYGRLGASVAWTLGVAAVFAGALMRHLPAAGVAAWLAAMTGVQVARLALRWLYGRRRRAEGPSPAWGHAFTVGAAASGLAWSVGPLLMLGGADPGDRALLLIAVVGVTAVAATQLASSWAALAAFASAALLPSTAWLAVLGTEAERVVAAALAVLWFMLLLTGRPAHRTHRALVVTQRRLADSLAASDAARAEAAAASARGEVERRRLANVVDGTGIAIAEWHSDDDLVRLNARFARMLGHDPAQLQVISSAAWLDLIHPEDRPTLSRGIAAHLASGTDEIIAFELRMRHRAGHVVWVQISGSVIARDADGRVAVLTGAYIDVTERKLEEQRWRARAELSADWFWETDEQLRVTYVSPGQREGVLPIPRDAMLGRTLAEVEGLRPVDQGWGGFVGMLRTGQPFGGFVVRVDGHAGTAFVELDGRPRLSTNGRFAGYEGTGRNVTDKVTAMQELRSSLALVDALFDTVPLAIAQKDTQGRTVRTNRAFQAMLGLPPNAGPIDTTGLIGNEETTRVHREVDRALLAEPGSRRYEVRQPLADGRHVDTLIHKATLCDAEGRILGLVGTLVDISDQKAAAQALAEARDAAEQSNRAKSFFLATMSHELRTPLNAVIGAAQLLRSVGDDSARRTGLIEVVEKSGASLLGLIENVMDLSRIEAGALQLGDEPFDLVEAVESAVATAAVAARHKGVAMACIVDPSFVAARQGDPLRVRQLVLNLLGNAVKFTPAGEVVVRVSGDTDGVRLEVRDTGVGIPADALPRIFDRFSQADQGATRRFGGSGLGLAIVHELVQAMGGRVEVDSRVGEGTCFRLRLPLRAMDPAPVADPADTAAAPSSLVGVPVAWYEPHEASADALDAYLRRLGCNPVRCHDPPALRDFLSEHGGRGWFLCAVDGLEAGAFVESSVDMLDPRQVIGMSAGSTHPEEAARDAIGLRRSLLKPVLRSTLVSRMAGGEAVPDFDLDTVAGALPPDDPPAPVPVAAPLASPAPAPAPAGRRARILLVEDDPTNRIIVGAMLESDGHEVEAAIDGHGALQAIAHARYDLVLMDWQMPDLDGLTVTRRLRAGEAGAHGRVVPIVALTANAFAEDRLACLQAGMNDFLTKPVQVDRLLATVGRWVAPRLGGTRPGGLGATRPALLADERAAG